jgi:glucose/arabinose dehydrogenase
LKIEPVWCNLNFPSSIAVGRNGDLLVTECGLPLGGAPSGGRVLRRRHDGLVTLVAEQLSPPVNGVLVLDHSVIVSIGGHPARLVRLNGEGTIETLADGFVGPGNYHLNMATQGPDEYLYFGVGAMTNTGVVGPDGLNLAWLRQFRHNPDVPGMPIRLSGQSFQATDPESGKIVETGAFCEFGHTAVPGQVIPPGNPATACIMRCTPDGECLELVAWGIRNAYGLGFLSDGRLIAVDQGADERGLRPVAGAPDCLFEIKPGRWYGWPDFIGGKPITDPSFASSRGPVPELVLQNHDELPKPEKPVMEFPAHSSPTKFAEIPEGVGQFHGHLLIALFGDERPMTATPGPRMGRSVVRVDPTDWSIHPVRFGDLNRPIDIAIEPETDSVYVVDFGIFEVGDGASLRAEPESGRVWRCSLKEMVASMM